MKLSMMARIIDYTELCIIHKGPTLVICLTQNSNFTFPYHTKTDSIS